MNVADSSGLCNTGTNQTMLEIGDVAATSLLTLTCHALESQTEQPILHDPKAVEIIEALRPRLAQAESKLLRNLAAGKVDERLVVHVSLRAKRYDEYVRTFLAQFPDGVIVNIGCGLDDRFQRIDNGQALFYDLDLPEIITLKRSFFHESARYRFIASSVLAHDWMEPLRQHAGRRFLFMAEGVFMYLNGDDVKSLVLALQSTFPGAELVCEVFNSFWLHSFLKPMINVKLQRELHLGPDVTFSFGIRNSRELGSWHPGIEFLDEWSYFDEPEPKLGIMRMFGRVELFRKTQWTVHYRLN